MNSPHKTALHLIFADESSDTIIVRHGPRRVSTLIHWDRKTDVFRVGKWVKARVYGAACALSPDGRHFLYFTLNGQWSSETLGAWYTLCALPEFTRMEIFPVGDTYGAHAAFLDAQSYWVEKSCGNCKRFPEGQAVRRVEQPKQKIVSFAPPLVAPPGPNIDDFRDRDGNLNKGISMPNYHVDQGILYRRMVNDMFEFDRLEQIADFCGMGFGDESLPSQ